MPDEPSLSKGQSSEWVTYLQQLLAYVGYWNGGETGEFDDALEQAVIAFQSANGLTADGQVGDATWAALTGSAGGSSSSGSSGASGGSSAPSGEQEITIPADIVSGIDVNNYQELSALLNSNDFDEYLRNYVGIDPAVFSEDDNPELVS
jgi:peptidoglycan hydrolase-like protein with peptidoglycan-binding domain